MLPGEECGRAPRNISRGLLKRNRGTGGGTNFPSLSSADLFFSQTTGTHHIFTSLRSSPPLPHVSHVCVFCVCFFPLLLESDTLGFSVRGARRLILPVMLVVLMVEESTSGINERTLRNTSKVDFLGCSFYPFFHANLILVVQSRRLPRFF